MPGTDTVGTHPSEGQQWWTECQIVTFIVCQRIEFPYFIEDFLVSDNFTFYNPFNSAVCNILNARVMGKVKVVCSVCLRT